MAHRTGPMTQAPGLSRTYHRQLFKEPVQQAPVD
jgi:hypothetical protein